MKEKRVLVTGGVGFIGTNLVKRLCEEGSCVEVVDDLSSSSMTEEKKMLYEQYGVMLRRNTVALWRPSPFVRYAEIYHLACRVGPAHVTKYAGRMAGEIVGDAVKMAELAIRDGAPLISISTSEVYGRDPLGRPQDESLPLEFSATPSARQEYTLGKYMTEVALQNISAIDMCLRVNLVRPFNIVGPGQGSEGGYVLPRFVAQALAGEPLTIFGDGTQTRAFTHVSDLVEALILIMESGKTGKIYNVGTPENTLTIADLASLVIDVLDSKSEIRFVDPQKLFGKLYTNAPSKIPSIDLIRREIGWSPEWSLREIIEDTAKSVQGAAVLAPAFAGA
jgi:UDP-glucose 4-epimerase